MRTRRVFSCAQSNAFLLVAAVVTLWYSLFATQALAQQAQAVSPVRQPLITRPVDESQLTVLKGNTHRLARPEFDLGTAAATQPMERMLLVLKRSPGQESSLRKLLDNQQDKASPSYHKWLTASQFGRQFGPADSDMQTIKSWLQSHGFKVGSTKGRVVLEFSGTASQVREAFHTTIHKYVVDGEQHWANASDPMIPTALTPAVSGILSLHNFLKKPAIHFSEEKIPAQVKLGKKPQVTFIQNGQAVHALSPADYRTIYNFNNISVGGEASIAVVGRSNLYNGGQDVGNFDGIFGGAGVQVILNGPDPGDLGGGEEAEATLDSTWSGAIAPQASVSLVVSASTDTTDGIDLSEVYIVENNLAEIMTESFSSCELYASDVQLAFSSYMAEQAAAQGITYFVSTGDDGAEGCDSPSSPPATNPISVNLLASTPFNVAVGGTMFNENGQDAQYWGTESPVSESAISYIPENVWNESSLTNGLWAGSGGVSAGNLDNGGNTPGVPKPSWQSGVFGIPPDGVRDLPDVSLSAAGHDPYLLCLEGSCVPNGQGQFFVYFISGTSASAPSFAGIMALVDDQASRTTGQGRQGLANYVLYRLAASQSAYPTQCDGSNTAGAPNSACIFNDTTVGNNVVPGEAGTDYSASSGYDLATGLGSVNVSNLLNSWNTVTFNPTTTTLAVTAKTIAHGAAVPFSVAVTSNSGTGTPTGDVSLTAFTSGDVQPFNLGAWTLTGGDISSTFSALPGGNTWVGAYYAGDATFAPSTAVPSEPFTVNPEQSTITASVLTADQNGRPIPFTSGPFGSFVYLRADVAGNSGQGIPTGGVTFLDGGSVLVQGSLLLNSEGNTATPNGILNFDTGTHTITATYSGDASFNPSTTPQSQSFTITAGFYVSISSTAQQVIISAPGGTGVSALAVATSTNFNGTIALACSGLPSEAACTFSPASIAANGTATSTPVSITVTTKAPTTAMASQRRIFVAQWFMGIGLFSSVLLLGGKRQRARSLFMLAFVALLTIAPSCGGGSSNQGTQRDQGTPSGQYSVVVSATSGTVVSRSQLLLVVQ